MLVDTAPPVDGIAMYPDQLGDLTLDAAWQGLVDEGSFRDLTEEQLAIMRERAVPQPHGAVAEPVSLQNPARKLVPMTAICTAFPASAYQEYAAQGAPFLAGLLDYEVKYNDLPTGHWPMWSKPADLARLIAGAAAD